MDINKNLLQRLAGTAGMNSEPLPGAPLVEVFGSNRVLIENHIGVQQYCSSEICVRVKFGHICVCGNTLALAHMSKERLVITGEILSIQVCKRRQ